MASKRQRLGQHMLVDAGVLAKIVGAANILKSESVCEAGTGRGILTAELCNLAKNVISFEIDRGLLESARLELQYDNLELVRGDLFRTGNLEFDVFVSNLPYSRSRDAIEWLAARKFDRSVIMVQKEFAEKLTAAPGQKDYRAVSALAGHCFKIILITSVDKKSFSPIPRVDSTVLKILPVRAVSKETIKSLNLLFSKRNRKANSVAAKAGIPGYDAGEKRVDQLSPSKAVELAEMLYDIRAS